VNDNFITTLEKERTETITALQHNSNKTCNFLTNFNNNFDDRIRQIFDDKFVLIQNAIKTQEILALEQKKILLTSIERISSDNDQHNQQSSDQNAWKQQMLNEAKGIFQPLMQHLQQASNAFAEEQNNEWTKRMEHIGQHMNALNKEQSETFMHMFNKYQNDIQSQLNEELTRTVQHERNALMNKFRMLETSNNKNVIESITLTINQNIDNNLRSLTNEHSERLQIKMDDLIQKVDRQVSKLSTSQSSAPILTDSSMLNTLTGPPELNALTGPPELNALTGPPELNALNGPPKLNAITGPMQQNAVEGPPKQLAIQSLPSVLNNSAEVIGTIEMAKPESEIKQKPSYNPTRTYETRSRARSRSNLRTENNLKKSLTFDQPITSNDQKNIDHALQKSKLVKHGDEMKSRNARANKEERTRFRTRKKEEILNNRRSIRDSSL
jgi:hypothetical protein